MGHLITTNVGTSTQAMILNLKYQKPVERPANMNYTQPTQSQHIKHRRKINLPKLTIPCEKSLHSTISVTPGTTVLKNKLYISGIDKASSLDYIKRNNISAIISLYNQALPTDVLAAVNQKRLFINIDDDSEANSKQYFEEVNEFINCNETVLVHCQAGRSRSASCVIAYLMAEKGHSFKTAYDVLKKSRDVISPNFSFCGQLVEFEDELNQSPEYLNKQFKFEEAASSSKNIEFRKRKSESELGTDKHSKIP